MKQFFFTALFFFTANIIHAQEYTVVGLDGEVENTETPMTTECETKYTKLKKMFDDMLATELVKQIKEASEELNTKLGLNDKGVILGFDPLNLDYTWLGENLDKTSFKSVEEAQELAEKTKTLYEKYYLENIDLFLFLDEASEECGIDFIDKLFNELTLIYGPDFLP